MFRWLVALVVSRRCRRARFTSSRAAARRPRSRSTSPIAWSVRRDARGHGRCARRALHGLTVSLEQRRPDDAAVLARRARAAIDHADRRRPAAHDAVRSASRAARPAAGAARIVVVRDPPLVPQPAHARQHAPQGHPGRPRAAAHRGGVDASLRQSRRIGDGRLPATPPDVVSGVRVGDVEYPGYPGAGAGVAGADPRSRSRSSRCCTIRI